MRFTGTGGIDAEALSFLSSAVGIAEYESSVDVKLVGTHDCSR
jgi:hypothetical protein